MDDNLLALDAQPDHPYWVVYQTVCAVFRDDPALSRILNLYRTFEHGEIIDFVEINTANLPALILFPKPEQAEWNTQASQKTPFRIEMQAIVPGLSPRRAYKLWNALYRAIYPLSRTTADAVSARIRWAITGRADVHGSPFPVFSHPTVYNPTPARDDAPDPTITIGEGSLLFELSTR